MMTLRQTNREIQFVRVMAKKILTTRREQMEGGERAICFTARRGSGTTSRALAGACVMGGGGFWIDRREAPIQFLVEESAAMRSLW
jgi:hypothetical protein